MLNVEMIEGADDAAIATWFAGRLRAALAIHTEIAVTVPGGKASDRPRTASSGGAPAER